NAGSAIVIQHTSTYDYAALVRVPGMQSENHASGVLSRPPDATKVLALLPMHELAAFLRPDSGQSLNVTAVVASKPSATDSAAIGRAVSTALNDSVAGAGRRVRFTTRSAASACDVSGIGWALDAGLLDRVDLQPATRGPAPVIAPNEGWVYLGDYDGKQWKT